MPVMQTLAKIEPCPVQCIDQRGFHQAGFIDRTPRTVIGPRGPFGHPVKDLELTELRLPGWHAFRKQIIDEGMLARTSAYREQRTQLLIEQIPFLLEAVESALWLLLFGLFEG
jgi:hypothetical protein